MLSRRQEAAERDSPRKLGGWSGLTREGTTQTLPRSWPRVPGGSRAGADAANAGWPPALPHGSASPPPPPHTWTPRARGASSPPGLRAGRPRGRRWKPRGAPAGEGSAAGGAPAADRVGRVWLRLPAPRAGRPPRARRRRRAPAGGPARRPRPALAALPRPGPPHAGPSRPGPL